MQAPPSDGEELKSRLESRGGTRIGHGEGLGVAATNPTPVPLLFSPVYFIDQASCDMRQHVRFFQTRPRRKFHPLFSGSWTDHEEE